MNFLTTPPLQFNYIPYPLWRRRQPALLRPLTDALYRRFYPIGIDRHPPDSLAPLVDYLHDYDLLPGVTLNDLEVQQPCFVAAAEAPETPPDLPLRLPAPWEPLDAVIINWPVVYPPLWSLHAQMAQAITAAAEVRITVPTRAWAHAAAAYLSAQGTDLARVVFLDIPTDDIWVRDYGPLIGLQRDGSRGALAATYATHPQYPQANDDAMAARFAARAGLPFLPVDLRTEGGNLLTDGAGTLLMTDRVFSKNPRFTRKSLQDFLHRYFDYEKLIITPRIPQETTGHVDLLVKLARRDTVLIGEPSTVTTRWTLRLVHEQFSKATNARGERYEVVTLPTLPLYYNWFAYPIRRSYTNALTVNGQVMVPVYGVREDDRALRIYADTLPDYRIIPINCKVGANGGGAVHCMTREVPRPGV